MANGVAITTIVIKSHPHVILQQDETVAEINYSSFFNIRFYCTYYTGTHSLVLILM